LYFGKSEKHSEFVSKALNRMLYKSIRLSDGAFARYTPDSLSLWTEDLYFATILLVRAYEETNSRKYLQEAIKQAIIYNERLKDRKTRIFWHGYFAENAEQSTSKWGRANGWFAMANVELLKVLPLDHPDRESILRIFRLHASSLRDFQSLDGRWHQILDNDTTYLETSASAMFVTAFAEGVRNDWLFNKAEFRKAAISGWLAIDSQIDEAGNVKGISPEAPILYSDEEYENLAPVLNHPAGLGAILYACIAIDKLNRE
jgi:rhamnogalacturonyl hydrolase YesR